MLYVLQRSGRGERPLSGSAYRMVGMADSGNVSSVQWRNLHHLLLIRMYWWRSERDNRIAFALQTQKNYQHILEQIDEMTHADK